MKPIGGAPSSLVSYDDLTKKAVSRPTLSVATLASQMVSTSTMPPGGGLAQAEIDAFVSWVQAGTVMGSCGVSLGDAGIVDPYDTPVVCSSGKNWTLGTRESPLMQPGNACISCHSRGEGPDFALGGTL